MVMPGVITTGISFTPPTDTPKDMTPSDLSYLSTLTYPQTLMLHLPFLTATSQPYTLKGN